jgi:glycosyltransferase involved in cell wall biosynthesis
MALPNNKRHETNCIKVAIDTVFFNMSYSGITRVWENLFSHLEIQSLDVEIILLIRGKDIPKNILKSGFHTRFPSSQIMHINEFAYPIMQQDIDYLNQLATHHKWNYFLSTYFTYCTVIPNILLIHDMIPETCNLVKNHMWIQKDLAIRNASQFICISNTTKTDLLRLYPYLASEAYPISVIHNSIHIESTLADSADALQFFNTVLMSRGIKPQHYILTIATNQEAYKNQTLVKNLLDKYQNQLAQKLATPIPLVVITKNIPNQHGAGIVANGVLLLSDISDAALQVLYKNAAVFINPSLSEGFGLPVFEAFSHNIPVVACNLPVYDELCPGAITYTENDADDLYQKITSVLKRNSNIQRRIETGIACVARYTIDKQVSSYRELFNSLAQSNMNYPGFLNIIFQSYPETNPARKHELEYCILANLENPAIKYIHDFSVSPSEYLPSSITNHPKYIHVPHSDSNTGTWLTYKTAFTYSSNDANIKKFGIYWGIINCDIMLAKTKSWHLIRGWLNSGFILAQSRHEYNPTTGTATMDANFSKLMHANTQDGWFYASDNHHNNQHARICEIKECDFEIGMLGCDNAIAHRLLSSGYKVINMPKTFPIWHYDIARGKNSSNFLEKHNQLHTSNNKPKNKHPERLGQALIPNYDSMLDTGGGANIDLITLINQLGGISNWEKYKLIAEMISSRICIYNP